MFLNHWLDFAPVEILLKKLNLTEMPSAVFFADYYFMVYSRGFYLTRISVARMLEKEVRGALDQPSHS